MSPGAFLYLLFVSEVFVKGQTVVIKTQQSVLARLGENAHLSCHLWFSSSVLESKIVQVTWQKTLSDEQKNVATYNQNLGRTVNDEFKKKVQFKEAGLQKNSIIIRNVTEQDGGCYVCVFSMFPDGSLSNNTCLHVYELHEPVLQVRRSKSPEESFVSCSATGRPAPTVTLTVPQQHLHLSQYNNITVTNTNNTVTVTTTAVLSGLHDDSTQVGCGARVDSGPQVEVVKRITELRQTSGVASKGSNSTWIIVLCVSVLVLLWP